MKKIISIILSSVLAISICVSAAASTNYFHDGSNANIGYDAIVKDGTLYVPVCEVALYGMVKSNEDASKGTVTIEALGRSGYFTLTAGSNIARKNGVNIVISGTPFVSSGVMYGPADFIGEQLGLSLVYDSASDIVTIINTGDGKISTVTEQQAVANPGEKMVTKSELEAAGKGPDSVNWRYQQDYLANKPIPESALIYKSKTAAPSTSSTGEKMVTKSELEAAGKGPDSVNWRYQQDYLANKPIPESALIYKPKTQNKPSSSSSSGSSYTPSDKGLIRDMFSPLTDTFDAIFGKGSADYYLEHGHL